MELEKERTKAKAHLKQTTKLSQQFQSLRCFMGGKHYEHLSKIILIPRTHKHCMTVREIPLAPVDIYHTYLNSFLMRPTSQGFPS